MLTNSPQRSKKMHTENTQTRMHTHTQTHTHSLPKTAPSLSSLCSLPQQVSVAMETERCSVAWKR